METNYAIVSSYAVHISLLCPSRMSSIGQHMMPQVGRDGCERLSINPQLRYGVRNVGFKALTRLNAMTEE